MHLASELVFVFIVLLAFTTCQTFASDIFVNGTLWKSINTPSIRLGHEFNITGKLVLADPPYACPKIKNKEALKGNIVWVTSDSGNVLLLESRNVCIGATPCSFIEILKELDELDVKGVVLENKGYGGGQGFAAYFMNYGLKHSGTSTEGAETAKVSGIQKILKDDSEEVTIHLVAGSNDVTETQKAWIAFSVVMGIFSLVILLLAISKLREFVKANGIQTSVPQLTLGLHIMGATWRILALVDPPFTRGIYPYQVTTFFDITLYPIVLTATLLIGFYWEDAMRVAKVHSIPRLQKMAIPFKISVGLLFGFALVGVILRAINVVPNFVSAINLITAIFFSAPVTIFYSIASGRVLKALYQSKSLGKRQKALYKMTLFLVGSAICMWLYLFEVIALAASKFTVTRYLILRFILYGGVNLMSLFQILAFQNPSGVASSSERISTSQRTSIHESFYSARSSRDSTREEEVELPVVEEPSQVQTVTAEVQVEVVTEV